MMASVDSQIEADVAHYYGWKTLGDAIDATLSEPGLPNVLMLSILQSSALIAIYVMALAAAFGSTLTVLVLSAL